jgi:hypothetical protein
MLHAWSTPSFSYLVDSVQDLDDKVAADLIKSGHAVEHTEPDPPSTISRRQQRETARQAEASAKEPGIGTGDSEAAAAVTTVVPPVVVPPVVAEPVVTQPLLAEPTVVIG